MVSYYEHEDDLPETPEVALANARAANTGMVMALKQSHDDLARIGEVLGGLHAWAEEHGHTETAADILDAWDRVEPVGRSLENINSSRRAALRTAQLLAEKRQALAEQLDMLEQAIEDVDYSDARVNGLYHQVKTDLIDDLRDEQYLHAYTNILDELYSTFRWYSGIEDYRVFYHLMDILTSAPDTRALTAEEAQCVAYLMTSAAATVPVESETTHG